MREQAEDGSNPFWQHDIEIDLSGLALSPGVQVRFRIHEASETTRAGHQEIVPLSSVTGPRRYFLGRPYVHEPNIRLTVEYFSKPAADGAIGQVRDVRQDGWLRKDIGQAQAWFYPRDRILVLWECLLNERYRTEPPLEDVLLGGLWGTWERWLTGRCTEARLIATPAWEPLYSLDHWQDFLEERGYRQLSTRAFAKEVSGR